MGLDILTLAVAKKHTDSKISELLNGAPEELDTFKEMADALMTAGTPVVTEADNGKFLRVIDGTWQADTVPEAEKNTEKF